MTDPSQDRFEANVEALAGRNELLASRLRQLVPSHQYTFQMTPEEAKNVAAKMTPGGSCSTALLVAGLDQGWLEEALYSVPCRNPVLPGYRPPLYFLSSSLEKLWAVLHLHDWQEMLADPRVLLFAGPDAIEQVRKFLCGGQPVPWPQMAATVEPGIWPAGINLDGILKSASEALGTRLTGVKAQLESIYHGETALRIAKGEKLRVLGITSRYTTFLQHSMRDWLAGMRRLGHETRLVIEEADHQMLGAFYYAQACAQFRPDLVLMIDHFRAEMKMLPDQVTCVMWVQDKLPNIFCPAAGAAQNALDYVVGHGRLECVERHGYPAQRFLATTVGINDARFAPRVLSSSEKEHFACDVSFVSHAGTAAETIIAEQIAQHPDPAGKHFLGDAFERLRAVYQSGRAITQPPAIRRLLDESMAACGISIPDVSSVLELFVNRINNALFRHQSIEWLSEMDINIHLYGKGWESHPRFARFARGVASNQEQLVAIHLASKINLQVFPHGAIHQRLLDGLAAGGFFLLRHCPSDDAEVIYRAIWSWCRENGVRTDSQLKQRASHDIRAMVEQLRELFDWDPYHFDSPLVEIMRLADDCQYLRSAAAVFSEQYPSIVFRSRDELHDKVRHFLKHEDERAATVAAMRPIVIQNYSYQSISRRLIAFIADDLALLERKCA